MNKLPIPIPYVEQEKLRRMLTGALVTECLSRVQLKVCVISIAGCNDFQHALDSEDSRWPSWGDDRPLGVSIDALDV